jgi:putative Holliday junction resolvase
MIGPARVISQATDAPSANWRKGPAFARIATLVIVRVLGIDLGSKRIGLAVSDEEGIIAFPAGILDSRGRKRDMAALRALISDRNIGRAVVGLPIHMDGRRGPEAEKALAFASDLSKAAGIPVDTLDERWTSQEAERLLLDRPKTRGPQRRKSGLVDEMAASIILRTYLAQRVAPDPDVHERDGS